MALHLDSDRRASRPVSAQEFSENPEIVDFLRCGGMILKSFRLLSSRAPA